ncbi:dynein assembly factor with WDR repeat domains 1-like [Silurus meridionalis]|uniref:Nucleoporin Nup159/Nup146 N-terminal domain-containing protein n=1 Tax=Silurus meridionalis TaxID=175797 RepID=A0A8T0BHH7_SILME|nr:dynein assembly factor with WDR repeat domains 1-like [Silurus meridionalis]XP_046710184.1 dynein assembly factor with WDR repeat domains 1-like [Silurus meridionalis]KAF7704966.1 hypothetical protein HF521_020252 [Silurus meridionalis]
MDLQLSDSRPAPSGADDEELQTTEDKSPGPGLSSMLDSDADPMDKLGKRESGGESESETEQDMFQSLQEPSSVSTHRKNSFSRSQPKTKGDLHIHAVLECGCEAMSCKFNEDGTLLAVGLSNGSIKVYKTDTGEQLNTLKDHETIVSSLPVTSLYFTHTSRTDNVLLATYASGCVKCWYVSGRECVWQLAEKSTTKIGEEEVMQRQTLCLSVSRSGDQAVTGGSDSTVHLYDIHTQREKQICRPSMLRTIMDGHSSRVFAVMFHPLTETQFISGGWDNTVQFWDTRQQHAVRMLYGPHVCGEALHIDPLTNQVLSGSWRKENTLEVWDYISCKKVTSIPADPEGDSRMYTCQWLGGDHIIAAGSKANTLRVIDRHSFKVKSRLYDLPYAVFSSSACRSGKGEWLIAATSGDRVFLLIMGQ